MSRETEESLSECDIHLPVPLGTTVYTVEENTTGDYEVFDWNFYGVCEDGYVLTSLFSEIVIPIDDFENTIFLRKESALEKKEQMDKEGERMDDDGKETE